jgi:hypothetical protein
MEKRVVKLVFTFILVMLVSCEEPETVVTNIIHTDGSITRKIEMRKPDNKFVITDVQVPLDSTWIISDSCEISCKGDTTWVRRAEKTFRNVDELNFAYKSDTGCNSNLTRYAGFNKKFRWFNTIYSFSETIGKRFKYGYQAGDFLNKDELLWFHSPTEYNEARLNGPDSLKYKSFSDSVEKKKDEWFYRNVAAEWIGELSVRLARKPGSDLCWDSLKKKEDIIVNIIRTHGEDFDKLWQSGHILKEILGESNALKYRTEADSALEIVEGRLFDEFAQYSVRVLMPGELISSNGFVDSSKIPIWPVIDEYFFSEDYEMHAESRMPNPWAWFVSAVFVLFVLTGVIVRRIKRGRLIT